MDDACVYPKVSVITLTYNQFNKIEETINSVFKQNYPNIEYIICDDGSKNFPAKIIEKYEKKGKKIKVIRHENIGTVKNFNMAIKNSTGKYIIPLSGDDCFASTEVISIIVEKFRQSGVEIITAKRCCISNEGKIIKIAPTNEKIDILINGDRREIFDELCISSFISGASTYYSRNILDKYGGFNEEYKLIEDFPFYAQYLLDGGKINFLDCITINYDMNGVTSHKKASPILKADRKLYYKKLVFPNIKGMSHIRKQELRFYYYKMCGSNVFILFLGQLLSCIDFITIKVIRKLLKIKSHM